MKSLALVGALLLALMSPALGQSCNYLMDDIVAKYQAEGPPVVVVILDDEMLAQAEVAAGVDATRGFIVSNGTVMILGLEVGGCLMDPIYLTAPLIPAKTYGDRDA